MRKEYAEALERLDRLHASGQISDNIYEFSRVSLGAGATKPKMSGAVCFMIAVAVVLAVLFVVVLMLGWLLPTIMG